MVDDQKELVKAKSKISKRQKELQALSDELAQKIQTHLDNFDADVALNRDKFKDDIETRLNTEYEPKLADLTSRIHELEIKISTIVVDESDESVKDAIEKRDYLNAAAVEIQNYYNILLNISELEFIELAVTTKTISMQAFRKEMSKMDYYKLSMSKLESKSLLNLDGQRNVWLQSLLLGTLYATRVPFLIVNAVKRARILHLFSKKYYVLVETLLILSQSTNEEIVETLRGVVDERKESLYQKKIAAEEALETLTEELQNKIDDEMLSCPDFAQTIHDVVFQLNGDKSVIDHELTEVNRELDEISVKLDLILGRFAAAYRETRDKFLNPSNDDRSKNLPLQVIWDFNDSGNQYFYLRSGLWVYTDKSFANSIVTLIIFQIRNYMTWGSVTFHVLDLLMATFLSPMMFEFNCDIHVYSLKDEQSACIDVLHDLLMRRSNMLGGRYDDIYQYNNFQLGAEAPTLPFELGFIFQDAVTQPSEKMVQLLSIGPRFGILLCVFVQTELMNETTFRTYERYIQEVVLVAKGGISFFEPGIYKQSFEKKSMPQQPLKK